jgi:hypothetical protein
VLTIVRLGSGFSLDRRWMAVLVGVISVAVAVWIVLPSLVGISLAG